MLLVADDDDLEELDSKGYRSQLRVIASQSSELPLRVIDFHANLKITLKDTLPKNVIGLL